MPNLYQFARIVEIRTKLVSISSYLVGTLYALVNIDEFSVYRAVLMFVASLAIDMGTTAFNTFFDYYRGIDSKDTNREEDKVLVHQGVAPGYALFTGLGLFAFAVIPATLLLIDVAVKTGIKQAAILLAAGIASMLTGYLYNGGKKPISRGPLGEIFAGGFLGAMLILLCIFIQRGSLITADLLIALPSTIFIASILTVNNTCDMEGDKAAGRKTLSILIGKKLSEVLIYVEAFFSFFFAFICVKNGVLPASALYTAALAALYSIPHYIKMHKDGFSHSTKGINMMRILRIFLVFSAALIIPLGYNAI